MLDYVRRMNAEEDIQDLGLLSSRLNALQTIVFLLYSERAFHPRSSHLANSLLTMSLSFFTKDGRPRFTNDVCIPHSLQYSLLALPACISTGFLRVHTEELPVHLQVVRQPSTLVEGIE